MSSKIHQNPDGSISIKDERYRINDRIDGQFDIIRERDGLHVGAFRLLPGGDVEAEGEHREIALAVAKLMAGPRGPVPLQ
jgi:hypothetical protein